MNNNLLPLITEEDREFLHYNPNTSDIIEWVQNYALMAVKAERVRVWNEFADMEPIAWKHGDYLYLQNSHDIQFLEKEAKPLIPRPERKP